MNKAGRISATAVLVIFIATPRVMAQLTEFQWNNPALVGAQSWQVDGNWNMTGWPDDPGRTEPDATIIVPSEGASTSVALAGNLTLDVGATNVTVASLKLGGTAGAVTTNITSTGGKLVFENYEANNTTATPDACAFNCGAALVTSGGVAGSTNLISAPVQINGERLEFSAASTNNITLSGPVTFANLAAPGSASSIRSFMPTGTKLTISGSISLVDTVTAGGVFLTIHDNGTLPSLVAPPENVTNPSTGTIEISGVIQDTAATAAPFGQLVLGTTSANQPLATLILSGANTYRGATSLNRMNLVLAHDSALGVDTAIGDDRNGGASFSGNQNPSNQFGFNLLSDNDSRTISIDARISQWLTITGSNSLTWAGVMTQANTRGVVNILSTGKSFTISGIMYGSSVSSTDTSTENRIITLDGTGTTNVTGGWRNKIKGGVGVNDGALGHFRKAGTGTVFVSDSGGVSDFTGDVIVDQGVMRFSTDAIFDQARNVTSTGGAIGVDTGTFTNAMLLQGLNEMGPGLNLNHGGLMLTAGESAAPIDFTAGDLANLGNMSVAAPQNDISYTGTITPAADTFTSVPTYRLGGGNGALTLPNNQLTGARNVQVTNGGEVVLNGANTYSGVTRIQAKYHTTTQNQAIANTATNISNVVYEGTTLTVNTLVNGGANSSIGSSSNSAANLVIQGSTLKYAGAGNNGTTDRLFTVGTGGATIDASGSPGSAMNFTNTGALAMGLAGSQTGSIFDTGTAVADGVAANINTRARVNVQHVDDIVSGMTLFGPGVLSAGVNITAVNNPTPTFQNFQVTIGTAFTSAAETGTITFGGVARTLSLTGANTGNNTLSPLIADAAAASGSNVVNVAKNGVGKWILTGNNSYTGTTNVNAGTLLINGTQTGAGLATVAAGATLGGTGTLGGALTNNGTVSPGASVGTLDVNGNVTMGANSHLAIELSGATADKLAITGNLDLGALGNFLDVSGVGTGLSWIIATYTGTLTGAFETITSGYSVDYGTGTNSQVTLNSVGSPGVPGDYNGNGIVDGADYVVWRNGGPLQNEVATIGSITPEDYTAWRARFGNTSGSGSSAGNLSAVPEPSCIVLIGLAMAVALGGARRRG
jgi:autotransporter-associated beta strand protein